MLFRSTRLFEQLTLNQRDAAASEGLDGAVARAKLYMEAGADAIFPEALNTADMFRAFAECVPDVPLLANMTEFGRTPFFTAAEFAAMGYAMVIWPVSSLRVANRAQAELYAAIARDGGTLRSKAAVLCFQPANTSSVARFRTTTTPFRATRLISC
jgi:2-methylisocitrate lyase-like PEP mutase family enzyme